LGLSWISGAKHDQICHILLGLISDVPLPNNIDHARLIKTVCSTLNFLYLAKYPIHSTDTLSMLSSVLKTFQTNCSIFIDLRICNQFDIPKLHFLKHYPFLIQQFGSLDNFNTEYTEHLHINLAKDAYAATNKKDEYSQMTMWLDCCT
jgi:hypothetical protein